MGVTIVSPTPGVVAGGAGGFPLSESAARATPIVVDITATSHELVQIACPGFSVDKLVVCRDGVVQPYWAATTIKSTISGGYRLAILPPGGWNQNILGKLSVAVDTVVAGGNVAPVASFTASLVSNRTYSVANASTDSDGTIVTYDWDWGDGTTHGTTATPGNHTYATDGSKTITLTVTDNGGLTNSTTRTFTVAGWTVDATSNKGVPATSAEWVNVLAQAGVSKGPPTYIWLCQDTGAGIVEATGSNNFGGASGSGTVPAPQTTKAGWSRKFIRFAAGSNRYFQSAVNATGSNRLMMIAEITGASSLATIAATTGELGLSAGNLLQARFDTPGAGTFVTGSNPAGSVRPFMMGNDATLKIGRATDDVDRIVPAHASGTASLAAVFIGAAISPTPLMDVGYMCQWTGADAEWTGFEEKKLMNKLGYSATWASCTVDATSGAAYPLNTDDWATIMVAAGVSKAKIPSHGWDFGSIVSPSTSCTDLNVNTASPFNLTLGPGSAGYTYQSTVSGWAQKGFKSLAGTAMTWNYTAIPTPASNSVATWLRRRSSYISGANAYTLMRMGQGFDDDITLEEAGSANTGKIQVGTGNGTGSGTPRTLGAVTYSPTSVGQAVLQSNITANAVYAFTESEKISAGAPAVSSGTYITFGGDFGQTWYPDTTDYMLAWFWSGTAAEMSSTEWKAIMQVIDGITIPWS